MNENFNEKQDNCIITAIDKKKNVRIKVIYGKDMVQTASSIHNLSPVASAALGRTLLMGSMIGSTFKHEKDKGTFLIKGDGPLKGLLVTSSFDGDVKGYVYNPSCPTTINSKGKLDVRAAIGNGTLTVIKDLGLKEPYSGMINLISGEIAEDFTYYFAKSEQTPSSIGLGVLVGKEGEILEAGGFYVSVLPEASDDVVKIIEENITKISSVTDILKEGKREKDILDMLFNGLEYDVLSENHPSYNCDCTKERVSSALKSISHDDLKAIIEEDGKAEIKCQFCQKTYNFSLSELNDILNGKDDKDNDNKDNEVK